MSQVFDLRHISKFNYFCTMYKRIKLIGQTASEPTRVIRPFCKDTVVCRPLSYYVRGGLDLSGSMNRRPVGLTSSSAEDVASGTVDMCTDARISRLDIASMASQYATESQQRSAKEISDTN